MTKYPGNTDDLIDYVGSAGPDRDPMIIAAGNSVTMAIEKYLGTPIGKRSCRYVVSRNASELSDGYHNSWLRTGTAFTANGISTNQWIELPCQIESIQSLTVSMWGGDNIQLQEGIDYHVDTDCKFPKIMLSWNMSIMDMFYKYKNMIVDFTGGLYEVDGTVPEGIIFAINMATKGFFENPGDGAFNPLDNGMNFFLKNYQVPAIGG
ncbi:hypothetical protein HKD28_15125 [Gluconobacter sp. LMG 1744]|uniref:hypothetical protein n=1 Tax=Gluconobacter cadivus TaxID=2728101 RepID=UPI001884BE43|nr:hypothetical protein [Gluconobacter cadivus]MBF0892723.1 hypothetical protein [Gluconobacter cadivus]